MAVIGPLVRIGRNCSIEAGAALTNALIGDGVSVGSGCRIGPSRMQSRELPETAPVLGRAILQDKVAIGSNSTVERGSNRDTIIGEGTLIDPLVRIPADVVLGRYCRIVAADGAKRPAADDNVAGVDGAQLFASQLNCADESYSRG
jgi:UDP-3-O-[3-hydroxymyristoyl] glucosamine N-acyltransferase